jgi:hypothetical protein
MRDGTLHLRPHAGASVRFQISEGSWRKVAGGADILLSANSRLYDREGTVQARLTIEESPGELETGGGLTPESFDDPAQPDPSPWIDRLRSAIGEIGWARVRYFLLAVFSAIFLMILIVFLMMLSNRPANNVTRQPDKNDKSSAEPRRASPGAIAPTEPRNVEPTAPAPVERSEKKLEPKQGLDKSQTRRPGTGPTPERDAPAGNPPNPGTFVPPPGSHTVGDAGAPVIGQVRLVFRDEQGLPIGSVTVDVDGKQAQISGDVANVTAPLGTIHVRISKPGYQDADLSIDVGATLTTREIRLVRTP